MRSACLPVGRDDVEPGGEDGALSWSVIINRECFRSRHLDLPSRIVIPSHTNLLVKVRIINYDKARDLVRLDRFEKKECSSKINSSCGGRCLSKSRSFNVLRSLAIPYCFYRTFNRRNDTLGMTLNPVARMERHRGASSPTASASLFRRIGRAAGIVVGARGHLTF